MGGLNIQMKKKERPISRSPFNISTPYDKRYGFWGTVTEVHPENCTVNVRMDTGQVIANVRVASMEWVTVVKDKPLTGERHLPPVDTFVFCIMPNGEINSSFVICSGFAMAEAVHADFKKEGDDATNIWEKIENSGWAKTKDYRTGTVTVKNRTKDETISVSVDQETEDSEVVKVTVHGTIVTIDKDGGIDIESDKDLNFISSKNGILKLGNTVATLGAMMSELLGYLSSLATVGSPGAHTASPDFIANINTLKAKWEQVFE